MSHIPHGWCRALRDLHRGTRVIRETWLSDMRDVTPWCDMTHTRIDMKVNSSYTRDATHWCVWRDSFTWYAFHTHRYMRLFRVTWLFRVTCDVTHSCDMWRDSFVWHVTWLIRVMCFQGVVTYWCDMTLTYGNVLPHTATRCNTLQHTATYCNTLQHTATHCNTLQHTATHCNTLQHTTMWRDWWMWHDLHTHRYVRHFHGGVCCRMLCCNTLQHTATHCSSLQHVATHNAVNDSCHVIHAYRDMRDTFTAECVAMCCDTLQHTATHCNTLQHIAPHCDGTDGGRDSHTHFCVCVCVCVCVCGRVFCVLYSSAAIEWLFLMGTAALYRVCSTDLR